MTGHYGRALRLPDILARIEETSPERLGPLGQFHSGGLAGKASPPVIASRHPPP
jgi:hypothetical protein